MTAQVRLTRLLLARPLVAAFLFALLLGPAAADEEPANLLENGSFEQVVPAQDQKDAGHGAWKLSAKTTPAGWTLNPAYPGELAVVEGDAADGTRCIQVTAGPKRDAQLFRICPGVQKGVWYQISVRVRDGTAALLTYEYDADQPPKPEVQTLASVTAPQGPWRTLTGFYTPIQGGFRRVAVALLVPKGGRAVLDDVRVRARKGPVADSGAKALSLGTTGGRRFQLVVSAGGQVKELMPGLSSRNLVDGHWADNRPTTPLLVAWRNGARIPVSTLARKGSRLIARFPDPDIVVHLRPKDARSYLLFEVVHVEPRDLEGLDLRVPVKALAVRDAWMPGTWNDRVAVAHMGVSANTETRLARAGKGIVLEARWRRAHGIRGGKSALINLAPDALLPAIRQLEKDTGLPSPMLGSDWARLSPRLKQSYLFVTHLDFGDIDKLIQYAQEGGFGLIMLHRKAWRASAGHERIARTAFPEGLSTLTAVCKRIHDAGLGVGLHLYGPAVSTNDAYVTPVPDKRLFSYRVGRLAAALKSTATELVLAEPPPLRRIAGPDLYPGDLLRLGDEIVRWKRSAPGEPTRLVGLERGVFGTQARTHKKSATVRTLVLRNGGLLVDPDSDLPQEMGAHLARVVNACRADLVYFDALASAAPGQKPETWYYLNKVLLASCAQFDHGVIVQTGMGPGRQLAWHLVPRSASADGHGDLKGYLDKRLAAVRQMRRTFVAADLGWYALDIHGRPDELEYVCAKALALDASISVQAHKALLESHPRAREVFDMIARWERRRLADDVPQKLRALLAERGRDVRLLEDGDAWSLWDARYDADRPIARIDGKANLWTVTNDRKHDVRLAFEIERVPVAATPEDHTAKTALRIDDLRSEDGFKLRDEPALAPHILLGGRKLHADGFQRRGVKLLISGCDDPAVGGKALALTATSSIGGAGWAAAGKTLDKPLDLSSAKSLGLWVHGDGSGASLVLTLADTAGVRVRLPVALDYEGWRFQSFRRKGPQALEWKRIAHVIFELTHMPPKATVAARVVALRAMPTLHEPRPMPLVTVRVGRREVDLRVELLPGRVITIDATGLGMFWPGGMQPGSPAEIAGGPFVLPPGRHKVGVSVPDPGTYAGDLRVRVCRTWPLAP